MAEKYPTDRFDEIPDDLQRVGAHRAPRPRGRGWIAFGWAALAVVVLVGAGIFGLSLINGAISFTGPTGSAAPATSATPSATPTPTVVPTVNPALSVVVMNGTTTEGLAGTVSDKLKEAGWKISATANADRNDIAKTVVYYSDPANQAAALGVVQTLQGATAEESQAFADTGADLTVVLGVDQAGQ